MKIVGDQGFCGLWALSGPWQFIFGSIDRYWRHQYISKFLI